MIFYDLVFFPFQHGHRKVGNAWDAMNEPPKHLQTNMFPEKRCEHAAQSPGLFRFWNTFQKTNTRFGMIWIDLDSNHPQPIFGAMAPLSLQVRWPPAGPCTAAMRLCWNGAMSRWWRQQDMSRNLEPHTGESLRNHQRPPVYWWRGVPIVVMYEYVWIITIGWCVFSWWDLLRSSPKKRQRWAMRIAGGSFILRFETTSMKRVGPFARQ